MERLTILWVVVFKRAHQEPSLFVYVFMWNGFSIDQSLQELKVAFFCHCLEEVFYEGHDLFFAVIRCILGALDREEKHGNTPRASL